MFLRTVLALVLSWPAVAWSQDMRVAEYERLVVEIQSLAERGAWDGVERAYQEILATGIPPTADEYVAGAQSARQLGNITEARRRIVLALEVLDIAELRKWLEEIDGAFGPVSVKGDPGKVALTTETTPFDPLKAGAITFAQEQVKKGGSFDGLLPAGSYMFGPMKIDVRPGVQTQRIDIRSDKYMRKLERLERKEKAGDGTATTQATGDPFYDR